MDVAMAEAGGAPSVSVVDESAYEKLQLARSSAEEIVAKMLSFEKEGKPKSLIRELFSQMLLNLINLSQANRSILLEEDRVKTQTEHTKETLQSTTLELHKLKYEKMQYLKAIKLCKEFKSKYPDTDDVVAEDEFFRDAPDELKSFAISNDNAHDVMLKRLNFELSQRKELCRIHQKLEKRKKILLEAISERKKFLSTLPSQLKSLKRASLPVQQHLGALYLNQLKQPQTAELVPCPLYVIYSQLLAQKEAFGENIDVEIVGSVKDAQAFTRQQANQGTGTCMSIENSRVEDDGAEEEEGCGQRRRKRSKGVPEKKSLDQVELYQTHPLKIFLHMHDDEVSDLNSEELTVLKFEYLLKLNVVCVGIEGSQVNPENNILYDLFSDDTGLVLPYQSTKLCFGDFPVFDEGRTSRPYKWVQHLAGIDFLPEVPPLLSGCEILGGETAKHADVISRLSMYRQQCRVQAILQKIRSRRRAQLALA